LRKETKNPWNNFEQERRISNRKLTICFVQKEGKGIKMKETRKEKVERWGKKRKVRKNQTTWKNAFLQWKFEEGNKVSIKLKQKQYLDNHFKEKHGGEM